jgi:MYND finger
VQASAVKVACPEQGGERFKIKVVRRVRLLAAWASAHTKLVPHSHISGLPRRRQHAGLAFKRKPAHMGVSIRLWQARYMCKNPTSVLQNQACCFHCRKLAPAMAQCPRCCCARFCSKACQQAAWPGHKDACKKIANACSLRVAANGEIDQDHSHVAFFSDVLQVRAACTSVHIRSSPPRAFAW